MNFQIHVFPQGKVHTFAARRKRIMSDNMYRLLLSLYSDKRKKKKKTEENVAKNVSFQLVLEYMNKKHASILIMQLIWILELAIYGALVFKYWEDPYPIKLTDNLTLKALWVTFWCLFYFDTKAHWKLGIITWRNFTYDCV